MSNFARICTYVVFGRNIKTIRKVLEREDIKSGVLDVRMPMTLGMHEAGDISFVGLEIGILGFATDNRGGESVNMVYERAHYFLLTLSKRD